jgi:hypothetical protein
VFGNALTEVWQVKIGEGERKAAQSKEAWQKFVSAVAEAGDVNGKGKSFHGMSLNLEERRWSGALGWESGEVNSKFLLVLLSGKVSQADFGISDQRKSVGQYSCEGSEEGTRCPGVEHVPCRVLEVAESS